jgi:hypothetical protein
MYPKNLNYPKKNYYQLMVVLKQLTQHLDLEKINPTQIHYLAHQQTSENQPHNWIYKSKKTGNLVKRHSINDFNNFDKIVNVDFKLELYPYKCNDTHIETATKRAIKELYA